MNVTSRVWQTTESISHILPGCGLFAPSKYLSWYNNAVKILFFEVIRLLDVFSSMRPSYLKAKPKPMYKNERVVAYCPGHSSLCTQHARERKQSRCNHCGQAEQDSATDRDELPLG